MKILSTTAIVFLSVSCVQIPQQSIDLSQTMGHDIKSVYIAHVNLAKLYFNSMEGDINDFVDDVYAPYQIGLLIDADMADFKDGLDNTLAGALRNAPDNPESAKEALQNMEIFVRLLREDIEGYRNELLMPIRQQRMQIITGLDKSYMNLISANESITAHLSSIKKVKESQSELIEQLGLEADLNEQMGQKIADLSGKISTILGKAEKIDQQSDTAIEQFNAIKDTISNLTNK